MPSPADGPPTLSALDTVDWRSLTHSLGKADDTPGHLRALLSDRPRVRESALSHLWDSICHQGYQISEASLHAIPFLVRLLDWRSLPQRHEVLLLLRNIAHGNGWFQGSGHMDIVQMAFGEAKITAEIRREAELQDRIAAALGEEQATIRSWLKDADSDVFELVLQLLGAVPDLDGETRARLLQLLAEADSAALRAKLQLLLGRQEDDEEIDPE